MISYLGDFVEDDVVYIMFNTFTSDDPSASSTITNFINTDVHIHKDDGLAQRNNAAGITVSVNFDGITGSHMIKIDTNDNTVAGFWVTGHDYFVRIEGTTVDGATINAVVGHFSIQNRYTRGTDSATLAATWTDAKAVHLDANISSRSTVTTAQVNDQVVDVLKTDTIAEPGQGAPPAEPTFEEALKYVYFKLRNKSETTATEDALYDDAGTTKLMKAAVSDNGTVFTKAEYVSGA
jgi:hypothetical protein